MFLTRVLRQNHAGMELKKIVQKLESFAPKSLAGSWDNVGLLIEPSEPKTVHKMMLTNDLTESVMDECLESQIDLILSYHPPIFRPLKRITSASWKERIVTKCLENRIALYSPHTAFDAVPDGVNDWLLQPFGPGKKLPLMQSYEGKQDYLITCHASAGDEIPPDAAIQGNTAAFVRDKKSVDETAPTLPQSKVMKLEPLALPMTGAGRLLRLDNPLSISQATEKIKGHLKLSHLRLALATNANKDSEVKSIAVCAGSGASVLQGCKADLWITGEMSHHEVLDAVHAGTSVILCEHSNTERGYLPYFGKNLHQMLEEKVEILVSKTDSDPLKII